MGCGGNPPLRAAAPPPPVRCVRPQRPHSRKPCAAAATRPPLPASICAAALRSVQGDCEPRTPAAPAAGAAPTPPLHPPHSPARRLATVSDGPRLGPESNARLTRSAGALRHPAWARSSRPWPQLCRRSGGYSCGPAPLGILSASAGALAQLSHFPAPSARGPSLRPAMAARWATAPPSPRCEASRPTCPERPVQQNPPSLRLAVRWRSGDVSVLRSRSVPASTCLLSLTVRMAGRA